jgi:glycosyltransferase involved in cell wall biosynthesis
MSYGLPKNYLAMFLLALALKSSDALIAISRESLRWAYRWSRKPGFVIYEGIDVERYDCKAIGGRAISKDPTVITVAFLGLMNVIRKDIPTLIKSIKIVKNRYPNIRLYVVGRKMDGYSLLKTLTQKLNLNDNVVFTGEISHEDLLKLLCRADLFVMTSYQEGFPTVACEAAAAGVPLIVSNRPAMNEVFTNENALLVNPGDSIELANTIIKSLENKDELAKLAEKATTMVKEKFNLDVRKRNIQSFITYFLKRCLLELRRNKKHNLYSIKMKYLAIFILFSLMTPILYLVMELFRKAIHRGTLLPLVVSDQNNNVVDLLSSK